MLVNKKYDSGDIICFKIVNGDEVVGKLLEESTDSYTISKPCTVVPSPKGIGLIQSMFSADINNNITLNKMHVMMHSPVFDDIKNHYIQVTTGIQPVTKGGIIT